MKKITSDIISPPTNVFELAVGLKKVDDEMIDRNNDFCRCLCIKRGYPCSPCGLNCNHAK